MNFRVLNYFLAVAREQNISKAADILHITQPTLSRQLKQLEEDLDIRLFDRTQNKLLLTEEGSLLVHRAQEIITLVEKTKADLQDTDSNLSGSISFGTGELETAGTLADMIRIFQEKYPAVTFELFTNTSEIIAEKMQQGLIDVALLLDPVDITGYNFIRLPQSETLGVLMRADAPLAAKKFITAADLLGKPVVLPTRLQVHSAILNWFSSNIYKMNFAGTSNLSGNTKTLVVRNNYYGITVRPTILDESKIVFRPLSPSVSSDVFLTWRHSSQISLTVRKFIDFARAFLRSA